MSGEVFKIKEFDFNTMEKSATWIVIAPPGQGKTTFIENVAYAVKHKYPVARVFTGSQTAYDRFCKVFGSLFVTLGYDQNAEATHIRRQKLCIQENGKKHDANYAINILDDVSTEPKIYKTPLFNEIFKIGSQHYDQLFLLALQYVIDVPAYVRNSVSYVAMFSPRGEDDIKRLYRNFGGVCGNIEKFTQLITQLTGDYTCMIIDFRCQKTNIEDCVYWYRTYPIDKEKPDWKFGCSEYREWNNARVDPNYVEPI